MLGIIPLTQFPNHPKIMSTAKNKISLADLLDSNREIDSTFFSFADVSP